MKLLHRYQKSQSNNSEPEFRAYAYQSTTTVAPVFEVETKDYQNIKCTHKYFGIKMVIFYDVENENTN